MCRLSRTGNNAESRGNTPIQKAQRDKKSVRFVICLFYLTLPRDRALAQKKRAHKDGLMGEYNQHASRSPYYEQRDFKGLFVCAPTMS